MSFGAIKPPGSLTSALTLNSQKMDIITAPMSEEDYEFSYQLKKAAMGSYIKKKWGWDENIQRKFHAEHWAERQFQKIIVNNKSIGSVWVEKEQDHYRFGEFYIFPEHQNKGIGSSILKSAINESENASLPIRLEYLKWNPVGALYKRNGFEVISENVNKKGDNPIVSCQAKK